MGAGSVGYANEVREVRWQGLELRSGAGASGLFASLLGYNPIQSLLGPHVLHQLPAATQAHLTGHGFFRR